MEYCIKFTCEEYVNFKRILIFLRSEYKKREFHDKILIVDRLSLILLKNDKSKCIKINSNDVHNIWTILLDGANILFLEGYLEESRAAIELQNKLSKTVKEYK